MILPLLFRNVWGLYIGKNSREFFRYYGTPAERLFPARYCVNNQFFRQQYLKLRETRLHIRSQFGINGPEPVVLFAGKLIDKKRPQLLLEAFRRVRQHVRCHLLFAGDGPLRSQLQNRVQDQGIEDVHWAGFLDQAELPRAYTAADIFVLPSAYMETWGLVVNEAMNFELPIVLSSHVGCGADLVEEGRNGHVFPSEDEGALVAALQSLIKSSERRMSYGRRSAEIVSHYSIDNCANEIVRACLIAGGRSLQNLN